jgi:acyl-coenzyme A synthetase/AMP-(fatty) acid ligase
VAWLANATMTRAFTEYMGCLLAGPMVLGSSQVVFEGVPTYPDAARAWDITDKYKVHFAGSPTHVGSVSLRIEGNGTQVAEARSWA